MQLDTTLELWYNVQYCGQMVIWLALFSENNNSNGGYTALRLENKHELRLCKHPEMD